MNMKKLSITLLSLILAFADVFAATGPVVSGVVKDAAGEPLIGVGVVLKGTVNGTVTDIDGAFSLEVPSDAVLTFSFSIRHQPQYTFMLYAETKPILMPRK